MSLRLVGLASGRGSNLKAILDAIEKGWLDATMLAIVCNTEGAGVIEIANTYDIPVHVIPNKGLQRSAHESQVVDALELYEFDYAVCAGYMRILSPWFLEQIQPQAHSQGQYKLINIHPSLLPAFSGINAYEQAFHYGVQVSGITIHFVDEQMDHGPILAQQVFERRLEDTLETFMARGLALEHQMYPAVLQELAKQPAELVEDPISKRRYLRAMMLA